jgi:cysteinyl-tRNA synthetase
LQAVKRIDVGEKKNKTDFALKKFSGENEKEIWNGSTHGEKDFQVGHMKVLLSMKYLGKNFDIHTGGIDHIPTSYK